ncbi:MAG TPA: dienelactone hydrolase family protein [Thermoplasmata archaeon]|nr:dienelactone hydrolase family protein [Thermoplasmata archaeon]
MRDQDELLKVPDLAYGSGVIGVCDICHKRQAVIVLEKERYKLCVIDFLNKTWIGSPEKPGRPLPSYRSERIWFDTDATSSRRAPGIVLKPTKVVRHPVVLITPDIYGLTTTLLDGAIRFAREGFEVMLPDVGKTPGVGPADHLSLRRGAVFGGGVAVGSARVQHLLGLYRDALRHLRARDMVDPAKTALFGASYGGSLAAALAGEDRSVTALALAYPVALKPVEYPRLITAPVLMVAGDGDRRTLAARRQFVGARDSGGLALETFELPGVGHNFLARDLRGYDLKAAEAAWARIIAFVRTRLLPPPPTPPAPPVRPATAPAPPAAPAPSAPAPRPNPASPASSPVASG